MSTGSRAGRAPGEGLVRAGSAPLAAYLLALLAPLGLGLALAGVVVGARARRPRP